MKSDIKKVGVQIYMGETVKEIAPTNSGFVNDYGIKSREELDLDEFQFRIILTPRCNHNCYFCHREGASGNVRETSIEQILEVANTAKKVGIKKIHLTGGEPLIRDDIAEIIEQIYDVYPCADVAITTNGYYLKDKADELRYAGLKRITVSLHTLDPEEHKRITRVDDLDQIIEGIKYAVNIFDLVKLNTVVTRDNIEGIEKIVQFGKENGARVRFLPLTYKGDNFASQDDIYGYITRKIDIADVVQDKGDLIITTKDDYIFEIKGAYMKSRLCDNCEYRDKCMESCKAFRIYPNKTISPCLMGKYKSDYNNTSLSFVFNNYLKMMGEGVVNEN